MDEDTTDAAWAEQELNERRRREQETTVKVYKAIAAVIEDMSKIGISKDRKNAQQGYKFRGIDDVYSALSPLLAKHGLCVLPRVMDRTVTEQTTKNGGLLFYTTLKVEFDFVAAEDGSKHTVCTIGEAMDSGDKSSNKAMSAAYKYACFQAFCIPTEGDNDADAHTHEVAKPDTRKVNEYSKRITEAVEQDNVDTLAELVRECREASDSFWPNVWATLGTPVKNYIKANLKKEA
jgi:hypothetical protein